LHVCVFMCLCVCVCVCVCDVCGKRTRVDVCALNAALMCELCLCACVCVCVCVCVCMCVCVWCVKRGHGKMSAHRTSHSCVSCVCVCVCARAWCMCVYVCGVC